MKKRWLFILGLTISLLLASCGPNRPDSDMDTESGPKAWFDAPLPNSVFYPPNPIVNFVIHASDMQGIASFELSSNGKVIAEIPSPNTTESLVTLTYDWHPPEPGTYAMTLRSKNNSGVWSPYAETVVIISASELPNPQLPPTATETATHRPVEAPPTPTNTPARAVISVEKISANLVYLGRSDCGPLAVTITALTTVPQDNIKVIILFYRFQTGNASNEFQAVGMNPIGDDFYQQTLNPTSLLGGSVPFDQATLQYQIVVQQNDDDTSVRTQVMSDIAVKACGNLTTSCSSYSDERTCRANGCQWSALPGTVATYKCEDP